MKIAIWKYWIISLFVLIIFSCSNEQKKNHQIEKEVTAKDILGNPNYLAISYGGYRDHSRDIQPSLEQLKEDMLILATMNIKVLRTYNAKYKHASNVLKVIRELKDENPDFEMYIILGAWIDCQGAFTAEPDHDEEDTEANPAEIQRTVEMANQYPDIVKIIAMGNEAMVKWAASYYVQPSVILKWVNHLQGLKEKGKLSKELWITSSDNFASWGGGDAEYHVEDLTNLVKAVDYVSMHSYPMHDTHYNPEFWGTLKNEKDLKISAAMERARDYSIAQYKSTSDFVNAIDSEKFIHIGETGWASASNGFYESKGSKANNSLPES